MTATNIVAPTTIIHADHQPLFIARTITIEPWWPSLLIQLDPNSQPWPTNVEDRLDTLADRALDALTPYDETTPDNWPITVIINDTRRPEGWINYRNHRLHPTNGTVILYPPNQLPTLKHFTNRWTISFTDTQTKITRHPTPN